jgi:hypothetical protein
MVSHTNDFFDHRVQCGAGERSAADYHAYIIHKVNVEDHYYKGMSTRMQEQGLEDDC